ncbi:hypothetical protein MNV49_006641 [Pseudohyphozyma bogoriensis]|nr:hypothetical protein MNV49_006641 [Pseudohyphozyma bogoriensis]
MSSTSNTTVAFFGATGGCGLGCLVRSLKAGYKCRALARTPQKLHDLVAKAGVPSFQAALLTIIQGPAQEEDAVKRVLRSEDGQLVQRIIFSIGAAPVFTKNPLRPVTLDNPTVCADSVTTLVECIASLRYPLAPLLTVISTTGTTKKRDVPYLFMPMYHWVLAVPHVDKRKMELAVVHAQKRGVVRGSVIIRPSLLMDGPADESKVKVGNVWGNEKTIKIGYTVNREDVGAWMFKELVDGGDDAWGTVAGGRAVTLTR